jgi:hypothetical protein
VPEGIHPEGVGGDDEAPGPSGPTQGRVHMPGPRQVRGTSVRTARQYALTDRAKALGWPSGAVQTIDEDQR